MGKKPKVEVPAPPPAPALRTSLEATAASRDYRRQAAKRKGNQSTVLASALATEASTKTKLGGG